MKYAFIEAEKVYYPVVVLCSVLGVSRSGFYAWRERPPAKRKVQDAELGATVEAIHCSSLFSDN